MAVPSEQEERGGDPHNDIIESVLTASGVQDYTEQHQSSSEQQQRSSEQQQQQQQLQQLQQNTTTGPGWTPCTHSSTNTFIRM